MHKKDTFSNGLRSITVPLKSTKAVTVLILAGAGSRYETKEIGGISHFLEHMFFKGAKRYKNAREVSETIDGIGGDFNAFTGKEYAGYYVKVSSEHVETAMDVLSDMLLYARFDHDEIEKERGVILEEYKMYQDTPMYQIGWDFERLMFGDQPIGRDQIGRLNSLNQSHTNNLLIISENYTLLIISYSHSPEILTRNKVSHFPKNISLSIIKIKPMILNLAKKENLKERVYLHDKKTEQAHIIVGTMAHPEMHKDHWAEKMLGIILGGNMSSRMFQSVREAQGLCYYIRTHADSFVDTGILSTGAGVQLKKVDDAIKAILVEYEKIRMEKAPREELEKAKNFMKGKMVLSLEDSEEYAHLLGKYELLHGHTMTPEEILKEVEAVTEEDVFRVAQDLLKPENMKVAVIGPYEDKERFEKLLGE